MPEPDNRGSSSTIIEKAAMALAQKWEFRYFMGDLPSEAHREMAQTVLDAIGYDAVVAERDTAISMLRYITTNSSYARFRFPEMDEFLAKLPQGDLIARMHQEHYRSCGCLEDSDECCVPSCECHAASPLDFPNKEGAQ